MRRFFTAAFICLLPGTALAQADANPVKSASDAFGHKRGDEAIGLYDERSVRGFSLEAAGNYRLNGTYFVKNSGVSNIFIDSSTVRIGYNTIETLLPGPSGVVDYRLRDPLPGEKHLVTATYDVYGQPVAEINFRGGAPSGSSSYSIGIGRNFDVRNAQGGRGGEDLLVAGITRVSDSATRLQIFAGEYRYRRRSEFRVIAKADVLPPKVARGRYLGPERSFDEGQRRIAGLLFDHQFAERYGIGATLAFGQEDPTRATPQFFESESGSTASGYLVAVPQQRSTAISSEVRAFAEARRKASTHRFDITLRYRQSAARFGGAKAYPFDTVILGERPLDIPEPDFGPLKADQQVDVRQFGIGAGYRGSIAERTRLNAGILKSLYRKTYVGPAGGSRSKSAPLLYNLGASYRIGRDVDLYASYSRGLEEAGVAPSAAANRNEILDAILVRQAEVGFRWLLAPELNLFLSAFENKKPYAGIDPADNFYRFLGNVRHRGVEASFTGRPAQGLQIVAGGVLLDPEIINRGQSGPHPLRPVAVPRFRAIFNADFTVPWIRGLSIDAGLQHTGSRAVRSSRSASGDQLQATALTTLNAGFRFAFKLGTNDAVVRGQILNLTNSFAWDVNSSETLAYNEPRRARILFTIRF